MVPDKLKAQWARELDRLEVLFLADHGGGYPDSLAVAGLTPEERLDILRGLGFRVADRYEMEGTVPHQDELWPWARFTNDMAVCLRDGFVVRRSKARKEVRKHGRGCCQNGSAAELVFCNPSPGPL